MHVGDLSQQVMDIAGTLGVDSDRLVTGKIHADLLLLPLPARCGGSFALPLQLYARVLASKALDACGDACVARRSVLLIKRSHKRVLYEHAETSAGLQRLAQEHGLDFEVRSSREKKR